MTGCASATGTDYKPPVLYMPSSVSTYFKGANPPEPVKAWLKAVIVQQCMIDDAFNGVDCPLAQKKNP